MWFCLDIGVIVSFGSNQTIIRSLSLIKVIQNYITFYLVARVVWLYFTWLVSSLLTFLLVWFVDILLLVPFFRSLILQNSSFLNSWIRLQQLSSCFFSWLLTSDLNHYTLSDDWNFGLKRVSSDFPLNLSSFVNLWLPC